MLLVVTLFSIIGFLGYNYFVLEKAENRDLLEKQLQKKPEIPPPENALKTALLASSSSSSRKPRAVLSPLPTMSESELETAKARADSTEWGPYYDYDLFQNRPDSTTAKLLPPEDQQPRPWRSSYGRR
jgi:hypothetical protein